MIVWPAVNASLNAASAALLISGYLCIRRRAVTAHLCCMGGAAAVSTAFFASYLAYHACEGSTPFTQAGWMRSLYFAILLTHTALAVVIVPMVLRTLYLAWRRRFGEHVALARWTLPLWLYVSVSGVVVYWMLYHLDQMK